MLIDRCDRGFRPAQRRRASCEPDVARLAVLKIGDDTRYGFSVSQHTGGLDEVAVVLVRAGSAVLPLAIAQIPQSNGVPHRPANLAQPREFDLRALSHWWMMRSRFDVCNPPVADRARVLSLSH